MEQRRIQTQSQQWQLNMQQDYDKVATFKQQSIENQLKIELWERFLGNWMDDNLYSEQDKELRSKTQTRINFWQKREQQAVKQQKKPAAFTLSGEDALKKLRAARLCKIFICRAPT